MYSLSSLPPTPVPPLSPFVSLFSPLPPPPPPPPPLPPPPLTVGGWTPLMYASYVGHDTVVNLLLDGKADPNIGTPEGLTSLMVAAGCGNESVCFFLLQVPTLEQPSSLSQQNSYNYTHVL